MSREVCQRSFEHNSTNVFRVMGQDFWLMLWMNPDNPMSSDGFVDFECATAERVIRTQVIIVNHEMINPCTASVKLSRRRAAITRNSLRMPLVGISRVPEYCDDVLNRICRREDEKNNEPGFHIRCQDREIICRGDRRAVGYHRRRTSPIGDDIVDVFVASVHEEVGLNLAGYLSRRLREQAKSPR